MTETLAQAEAAGHYSVLTQLQVTQFDPVTSQVVEGWRVTVLDNESGTRFNVFVPASAYTVEGVDTMVKAQLQTVRGVAGLGS